MVEQVHQMGETWFVPTWETMVDVQRLRAGECLVIGFNGATAFQPWILM